MFLAPQEEKCPRRNDAERGNDKGQFHELPKTTEPPHM
jgi:hypothetical protein